jgi:hypothetical protein
MDLLDWYCDRAMSDSYLIPSNFFFFFLVEKRKGGGFYLLLSFKGVKE